MLMLLAMLCRVLKVFVFSISCVLFNNTSKVKTFSFIKKSVISSCIRHVVRYRPYNLLNYLELQKVVSRNWRCFNWQVGQHSVKALSYRLLSQSS